jgi:1,4-dihydroxy-2-naphthoate octaprenyltransferase
VAGVGTGALACAILVLNNLRDIESDTAAGKRTLATRIGRRATRGLLAALLALAYLAPVAAWLAGPAPAGVLLTLISAPLLALPLRASTRTAGPPLVAALKQTAAIEVVWALLWTLGVVLT